jgi:hypothetical protein
VKTFPIRFRLGAYLVLLSVAFVILSFATRAQSPTMTFATVDNVDTVAFDPHEISEQQLRQLILLSPFIVSCFNDLPHRDFLAAGSSEENWSIRFFSLCRWSYALPLIRHTLIAKITRWTDLISCATRT